VERNIALCSMACVCVESKTGRMRPMRRYLEGFVDDDAMMRRTAGKLTDRPRLVKVVVDGLSSFKTLTWIIEEGRVCPDAATVAIR
jgi:hypothetical protein